MKRRRVLFAVSSLAPGGAERTVVELSAAFSQEGHHVGVLTLSGTESDHYVLHPSVERLAENIQWPSANPWQSVVGNLSRQRIIRNSVRRFAPDVVLSFGDQTNVRLLAASLGTGIPVVVSERTDPRQHRIGAAWNNLRRWLYPRAAAVVVQTRSVAEWARGWIAEERLVVIPNHVRALQPATLGTREKAVLAVGRLDRFKGFDLLLRAFASSRLPVAGYRLILLGEGPERSNLEALAMRLGVFERLEMPGVVAEPEAWMARCEIFVLSSRYEGFPNVLLEAMAMGCAVVATDCPSGPAEIIEPGKNGILVPVDDADSLRNAMERLAENEKLREQMGNAAIDVRKRFSRIRVIQQWFEVIKKIEEQ
ncbi:MAG: glycosyltransferase family 4 protein [Calditrichaeota bacterium]|nr:MAG: glycosyltransferase family 4 protein [Calditrichota bacterium]